MNARDERTRVKREGGQRVRRRRWDLEANPSHQDRLAMIASGIVIAAQSELVGDALVYHGVFIPQQIPGAEHAVAVVCHDRHPTLQEALDCAAAMATLIPIQVEVPVRVGPTDG